MKHALYSLTLLWDISIEIIFRFDIQSLIIKIKYLKEKQKGNRKIKFN